MDTPEKDIGGEVCRLLDDLTHTLNSTLGRFDRSIDQYSARLAQLHERHSNLAAAVSTHTDGGTRLKQRNVSKEAVSTESLPRLHMSDPCRLATSYSEQQSQQHGRRATGQPLVAIGSSELASMLAVQGLADPAHSAAAAAGETILADCCAELPRSVLPWMPDTPRERQRAEVEAASMGPPSDAGSAFTHCTQRTSASIRSIRGRPMQKPGAPSPPRLKQPAELMAPKPLTPLKESVVAYAGPALRLGSVSSRIPTASASTSGGAAPSQDRDAHQSSYVSD